MPGLLPDSYRCKCGITNLFSAWVYAHWDEPIHHTCKCGKKVTLWSGEVIDMEEFNDDRL